jgi:hypothetical protein
LNFFIFYPIIAIFAILFKKGVEKWDKFRNFAYLEAIDIEIVKQDIFPKYTRRFPDVRTLGTTG